MADFASFLDSLNASDKTDDPKLPTGKEFMRQGSEIIKAEGEAIKPYQEASSRLSGQIADIGKRLSEEKLPAAPELKELPKVPDSQLRNPMQGLGGVGSLLAIIGSLATRRPAIAALNAGAAAMKGFHQGDKERVELDQQKAKDEMTRALKQSELELRQYDQALKAANFDMGKARAQMSVIAAQHQDVTMQAALEAGKWDKAYSLLEQRTKLTEKAVEFKMKLQDQKEAREARLQAHRDSIADVDAMKSKIPATTVDFYATQALNGDYSWQTGLARGKVGQALIGAVKDRIPQLAAERGMGPMDASANKANMAALSAALKDRQKYLATATQFVGNFDKQSQLVEKYLDAGTAGGVPAINKWIQVGRKAVAGDPDVTNLDTAIRGLAREHQRIVTGVTSNAQLHASAQETADQLLNKDMTADQIRGTLGVMHEEAQNALDSGRGEVELLQTGIRTMGQPPAAGTAAPAAGAAGWTPDKEKRYQELLRKQNGAQ